MKTNKEILQQYAVKHNLVLKYKKGQPHFEDALPPVDYSAVVAYTVIGLGVLFAAFCLVFVW